MPIAFNLRSVSRCSVASATEVVATAVPAVPELVTVYSVAVDVPASKKLNHVKVMVVSAVHVEPQNMV